MEIIQIQEQPQSVQKRNHPEHFLRIFQFSDIYTISPLAKISTLIKQYEQESDAPCVKVVVGDFLAPYLLSSLDHGRAMIEIFNMLNIDFVCFGNHESDVPFEELQQRILESNFTWLNTNMVNFNLPGGKILPSYEIMVLDDLKIGFCGVLTDDKTEYKKGTDGKSIFGGVEFLNPNDSVLSVQKSLQGQVDLLIPLTHQLYKEDCKLAEQGIFPIILGGHEHHMTSEKVNGCIISKAGHDGEQLGIIDLYRDVDGNLISKLHFENLKMNNSIEDDPEVLQVISEKLKILEYMKTQAVYDIKGKVYSSKLSRIATNSMGSLVATSLKEILKADCCILNGGQLRTDKFYLEGHLTKGDVLELLALNGEMIVIELPGYVIEDSITYSRKFSPQEFAGFFHADKGVTFEHGCVLEINKLPFEPFRMYDVVIDRFLLQGGNGIAPLGDYLASLPQENEAFNRVLNVRQGGVDNLLVLQWMKEEAARIRKLKGEKRKFDKYDINMLKLLKPSYFRRKENKTKKEPWLSQ